MQQHRPTDIEISASGERKSARVHATYLIPEKNI